jgi:transcriptional antiterminator RfaH
MSDHLAGTSPYSRWYVVQTQLHAETKAANHLRRQDFPVYLPRYLKRRRHARRTEIVAAPLFPRYMFVAIDQLTQRWRSIRSTIGVAHLICNSDGPAPVPEFVIDELRGREDESGLIRLDAKPRFAPGDPVLVIDGIFSASRGLFDGMTGKERVAILLDLLGRKVRVVLDGEAVAAA